MLNKLAGIFGRRPRSERDTDHDWRLIGATEPYFGVITAEKFKRSNLDDEARDSFYLSGRQEIEHHLAQMRRLFGEFVPRSALDFGCGVGRLTVPLADVTGDATGVDVSPGMLAEARQYESASLAFEETIPNREFDWVVSYIVLQHIPPERGYEILQKLLSRIADGGGTAIQIVFARTEVHARSAGARVVLGEAGSYYAPPQRPRQIAPGIMLMHDYDLSRVIGQFFASGFRNVHLEHTDHGGMIGVVIYARKPSL